MKQQTRASLIALTLVLLAGLLAVSWMTVQPTWTPIGSSRVDAKLPVALRGHVMRLASSAPARSHGHPAVLDAAARYIETELKRHTKDVTAQRYDVKGISYRNVIAHFGPDTPDIIVIGAHYDVAGDQPGADDNASGVAGLIELARHLSGKPLNRRVELVAYTLEEPPYFRTPQMGSAVHAASLRATSKRVSLMLSLECIGYFSDEPESQKLLTALMRAVYPSTGNFIAVVGNYADSALSRRVKRTMQTATQLPVFSINAPAFMVGIDFSDHLNYWNEGFVGLMVTDTAFYRNEAYHTEDDTPERLDYQKMAEVVSAVVATVMSEATRSSEH